MIKVILLEVYLPVVSSHGLQHVWERLNVDYPILGLLGSDTINLQTNSINCFKVKKGQSKEISIQIVGTTRLPKVGNDYGNRGIIVPAYFSTYSPINVGARERIPDIGISMSSTDAGSPVQIKSNVSNKLLKLAKHCKDNPDTPVSFQKIYRLMYDPVLYEIAYEKLKSKPGNMTPGITPTTLDGMSMDVISKIISSIKDESFKFTPGRRVEIPKASGGSRPLTVAPPRDKIVQEVMRMILEAIFEPRFEEVSHGFRPYRSCHTALRSVKEKFGVAT